MTRPAKIIPFPGPRRGPARTGDGLVDVRRCRDQGEALVVQSLLDSERIPSVLRGKLVHSVHPFAVGDLAEVAVLVAPRDAERALRLLRRPAPAVRALRGEA